MQFINTLSDNITSKVFMQCVPCTHPLDTAIDKSKRCYQRCVAGFLSLSWIVFGCVHGNLYHYDMQLDIGGVGNREIKTVIPSSNSEAKNTSNVSDNIVCLRPRCIIVTTLNISPRRHMYRKRVKCPSIVWPGLDSPLVTARTEKQIFATH